MELKIRNKAQTTRHKSARIAAIVMMVPLLALFITRFDDVNQLLLGLNRHDRIMPYTWWSVGVKFISYCIHILLNFCLLLAITDRLRYSLAFVYIAFAVLIAGIFIVALRDMAAVNVPLTLVALFVKINKSPVLLVLFIAGHIVELRQK